MTSIQAALHMASRPPTKRLFKAVAIAAILALAAVLLRRTLSQYSFEEIVRSVGRIPIGRLGAAFGFAAASYLLLTGFDWLALRYARRPLAWRRAALASFTALSIGHNLGFAALSSGALRYRFYSRWGLGAGEVAQVIVFCGLTVAVGLFTLAGVALLLRPGIAAEMTGLAPPAVLAIGGGALGIVAVYLGLALALRRPLSVGKLEVRLPHPALALTQIGIGTANFACVAACLYHVLAAVNELSYFSVAAAYAAANGAGLISHVPGGLGVLESVVSLLLPNGDLIGALVAFRAVYYLAPLCLGGCTLALSELLLSARSAAQDQAAR